MKTDAPMCEKYPFSLSLIEDLKLASSKMSGPKRRSFQAEMALKYCEGSARKAEAIFGWSRNTVQLGLHEKRTGIICLGAQSAFCGRSLWEEDHPEAANALWKIAESYSQQDPTFRTTASFTRLTAKEALKQLRALGFEEKDLPSPSAMANILNRNGFRLRPVVKAKPQKKLRRQTSFLKISERKMGTKPAQLKQRAQ